MPLVKALGGPKAEQHAKAYYEDLRQGQYGAAFSEAVSSNMAILAHAAEAIGQAWTSVSCHDKPSATPPAPKGPQFKGK